MFNLFLESLLENAPEKEKSAINSILLGFNCLTESLSTDDANINLSTTVFKSRGPSPTINKKKEEYFDKTLPDESLSVVEKSKFGYGRVAKYPDAGRDIITLDPLKNQFTGSQYHAGDSTSGTSSSD